jgi:hypothetical protein
MQQGPRRQGLLLGASQSGLDLHGSRADLPVSSTAKATGPGPAPPHPGHPPAPRFYGNGRAPEPGRWDEEEPQRLSGCPHRHLGPLPCPADVPARDAA